MHHRLMPCAFKYVHFDISAALTMYPTQSGATIRRNFRYSPQLVCLPPLQSHSVFTLCELHPGLQKVWFYGYFFFFLNRPNKKVCRFLVFINSYIIHAQIVFSSTLLAILVESLLISLHDATTVLLF